jgi:hypothetical protein
MLKRLIYFAIALFKRHSHNNTKGAGVSILIPARCVDKDQRLINLQWIKKYWHAQLPGAEVIVGEDWRSDLPFSKSVAVNDAAWRSEGDVLVITDTDIYIDTNEVMECVKRIRHARARGHRLWFIPYRQFYRLTKEASARVLRSDPKYPYQFSVPPDTEDILDTSGSGDPAHGHWFGAGIQILPREAFECVGGWDERFRGWGGEDHSIMMATDTLYWPHKTLSGQALHLWHPMLGSKGQEMYLTWKYRMWKGQTETGANDDLCGRYYGAYGHPHRMRKLIDEQFKKDKHE